MVSASVSDRPTPDLPWLYFVCLADTPILCHISKFVATHQHPSMTSDSPIDPFWGLPSSKANFCEKDYVVTRYVAEFINTLTNLVYVFYAIYGLYKLRQKSNTGFIRVLPYWGLMTVGVCSAIYHASLQYHTQMLDDLSMLFATTPVLHRVLTVNSRRRDSFIAGLVLYPALTGIVIYHVSTDELILHAIFFVGSVAIIGIRTMQLVKLRTPENSAIRQQVWGMVRFGAFIFHLGYSVWLLDGWLCDWLRTTRAAVGLPWAWLLELHGWWHTFTGIGAYIFIALIDHLVSGEDLQDIESLFAWPAPWASRSIFAGTASTVTHKKQH
ncbi:ceramidase [Aspergillus tanneri]|uniref:Alkaline ceramidase 3 n=1 Tax=Aspergillus tanneri TaxID=1220188 RepID=A0A5M9N080_9EURO|nr:uncharacterized protein ATNIH1004_003675 [Aspergillus tanneri]KAA8650984.1 hypothetical protein ATNIH1004_003675 [Aspergillus tanneri]